MEHGIVVSIQIAPSSGAPVVTVQEALAVAGNGLDGDRYAGREDGPANEQVTLVEIEAVEALGADGIPLEPEETRRNIVTRGIRLNDLVGRDFRVGEVLLHGHELCEPCAYLTKLTGKDLLRAMVGRGGLRAEILGGGIVHVGDVIVAAESHASRTSPAEAAQ